MTKAISSYCWQRSGATERPPPMFGSEPGATTLENSLIVHNKVEHMCTLSPAFSVVCPVLDKLLNIYTKNVSSSIIAIFFKKWNNSKHSLIVE